MDAVLKIDRVYRHLVFSVILVDVHREHTCAAAMSSYTASTTSYHPSHHTTTYPIPSTLEAKIVVLGAQGVGKTSLGTFVPLLSPPFPFPIYAHFQKYTNSSTVHRFIHNTPPSHSTPSTIGASFLTKRLLDPDTSTLVRLQIWDTAGQERFRSISRLYYRGANACIICYDITSESSFAEMGRWLTELRKEVRYYTSSTC